MDTKSLAQSSTGVTVDERIRLNAAAHPERTYSEHVAAAQEIAAESYREEVRHMMKAGILDVDEEDELEGV